LPPPATLPALRRAAAPERSALPAIGVVVRHGGGPRAALHPVSVCGDLPTDAQPGCRDYARPMHAGVRADRRKDGFAVTLPPGADAAGGVSAARQATGHGNRPAATLLLAPGRSKRLSRGPDPSRRWRRNRLPSPLTAATFGRLVSIRGARSRFSSLRSAMMRGNRSYSPACRRRRLRKVDSRAEWFTDWKRRQRHRSPS
jgi:hypothetical protein